MTTREYPVPPLAPGTLRVKSRWMLEPLVSAFFGPPRRVRPPVRCPGICACLAVLLYKTQHPHLREFSSFLPSLIGRWIFSSSRGIFWDRNHRQTPIPTIFPINTLSLPSSARSCLPSRPLYRHFTSSCRPRHRASLIPTTWRNPTESKCFLDVLSSRPRARRLTRASPRVSDLVARIRPLAGIRVCPSDAMNHHAAAPPLHQVP